MTERLNNSMVQTPVPPPNPPQAHAFWGSFDCSNTGEQPFEWTLFHCGFLFTFPRKAWGVLIPHPKLLTVGGLCSRFPPLLPSRLPSIFHEPLPGGLLEDQGHHQVLGPSCSTALRKRETMTESGPRGRCQIKICSITGINNSRSIVQMIDTRHLHLILNPQFRMLAASRSLSWIETERK